MAIMKKKVAKKAIKSLGVVPGAVLKTAQKQWEPSAEDLHDYAMNVPELYTALLEVKNGKMSPDDAATDIVDHYQVNHKNVNHGLADQLSEYIADNKHLASRTAQDESPSAEDLHYYATNIPELYEALLDVEAGKTPPAVVAAEIVAHYNSANKNPAHGVGELVEFLETHEHLASREANAAPFSTESLGNKDSEGFEPKIEGAPKKKKEALVANAQRPEIVGVSDRLLALTARMESKKVAGEQQNARDHAERQAHAWEAGHKAALTLELPQAKLAYQSVDIGHMAEFEEGFNIRTAELKQSLEDTEFAAKLARAGIKTAQGGGSTPHDWTPSLYAENAEEKTMENGWTLFVQPAIAGNKWHWGVFSPENNTDMPDYEGVEHSKDFAKDNAELSMALESKNEESGKRAQSPNGNDTPGTRAPSSRPLSGEAVEGFGGPKMSNLGDIVKQAQHMKPEVVKGAIVCEFENGEVHVYPASLGEPTVGEPCMFCDTTDPVEDFSNEPNVWIARMSAPGYMDSTTWHGPFPSEKDALHDVEEMYDEMEEEDAEAEEHESSMKEAVGKEAWGYKGNPPKSPEDKELIDMGKGEHVPLENPDAQKLMAKIQAMVEKEAVDQKTKDYFQGYFGGYGKQLTKDIALKKPKNKSSSKTAAKIESFWVVTKPTPDSEMVDVLFESSPTGMLLQGKGGLTAAKVHGVYDNEAEAKAEAEKLLGSKQAQTGQMDDTGEAASKEEAKAKAESQTNKQAKTALNEHTTPPTGNAMFEDSQKPHVLPPATRSTVMWLEDAALHGDRNEVMVGWDKELNKCCDEGRMRQHLKTFIQQLGTQMEKNWGVIADIQVLTYDEKACQAVVGFASAFPSPFVPEARTTELRDPKNKDERKPMESHDYKPGRSEPAAPAKKDKE